MDKMDYAILDTLLNADSTAKMNAVSLKAILEKLDIPYGTLYRRISGLAAKGYIEKGIKESYSDTYYITGNGKKILREAMS